MTRRLDKSEYIEQAYLFNALHEGLSPERPLQDLLAYIKQELLATADLPKAIEYLLAEINLTGQMSNAMKRMDHYFTPFQTFLVGLAEEEKGHFEMRTAMRILAHDAKLRSDEASASTMFFFQFETLCRNQLRYDHGLAAMSFDPVFNSRWAKWVLEIRHQIGIVDLAALVYVQSQHYINQQKSTDPEVGQSTTVANDQNQPLFGVGEGRIALANRGKEPLLLFRALQRHLSYPAAPKREKTVRDAAAIDQLTRIVGRLESRIKLLEEEQRTQGIDLRQFYQRPSS